MRQAGLSLIYRTSRGARRPEQAFLQPGQACPRSEQCYAALADDLRRTRAMTDYNPRTATGIPTEPVGSLPRPSTLQQAYGKYDAGEITKEDLEAEQDKAVKDSIEHLEATGAPIISDGEQRWSSFATYAITDTLAGTGLADHLAGDGGQYFAIFADGHRRQLPRLTGGAGRVHDFAG